MLWASWLIWVIDHRLRPAAWICLAAAVLTLTGVMHSPFADGRLFLPWRAALPMQVYALAGGYALLGLSCVLLDLRPAAAERGA